MSGASALALVAVVAAALSLAACGGTSSEGDQSGPGTTVGAPAPGAGVDGSTYEPGADAGGSGDPDQGAVDPGGQVGDEPGQGPAQQSPGPPGNTPGVDPQP